MELNKCVYVLYEIYPLSSSLLLYVPLDFSHLQLYDKLHCLRLLVDRLIKMFHGKTYSLNFLKVYHDQYVLKSKFCMNLI